MALDFFAGCVGGCAGVIVGHPLDTIKVHIQTQCAVSPKYTGSIDCANKIFARDGLRGFYRGISSPLLGIAGINAIVFGIYGYTQRRFDDQECLRTHFLAGSCAGAFQSILASPVELVKLRAQVSKDKSRPLKCMRVIYNNEGLRGVYRGVIMTVLRDVPSFASYFLSYEYMVRMPEGQQPSTKRLLMAGGLAGVISWIISYPLDVIKTRLQIDGMHKKIQYKNAWDCLNKIITKEGYRCLWYGLSPTLLRAFPVNAAVFTVVTWTMRLVENNFRCNINLFSGNEHFVS